MSELFPLTGNFLVCDEEEEEVAALAGGREGCDFTLLKNSCTFSDMSATEKGLESTGQVTCGAKVQGRNSVGTAQKTVSTAQEHHAMGGGTALLSQPD